MDFDLTTKEKNSSLWYQSGPQSDASSGFILTVVGVVADDMVPSAPVPQQECRVSGPGDDVAVASDVRLWSGQTCHHVPVTENDLGQLA